LEKIIKVEAPFSIAAMVAVGKPAYEPIPKKKREIEDLLTIID